jgi:nucleoside 2-deoxyribosyltransferase
VEKVNTMKVIVCGPIAYGSVEEIRMVQKFLEKEGYDVIDQFKLSEMDYSSVEDFRDRREVAERIVKNDLAFVDECDILVALCDGPSFGTAIETFYAKMHGKTVIVLSEKPQPSPWPIAFADTIVKSLDELKLVLSNYIR